MIGDAILMLRSADHEQAEVGYIIDPAHQGQGYATETTQALLELALGEAQMHRACGHIEVRNLASARVLERAGLRREATLIENEFVKGEWQSEGIYGLLRSEWLERRQDRSS
jgi:RimJ/RimL family protein N-acetyltransferase